MAGVKFTERAAAKIARTVQRVERQYATILRRLDRQGRDAGQPPQLFHGVTEARPAESYPASGCIVPVRILTRTHSATPGTTCEETTDRNWERWVFARTFDGSFVQSGRKVLLARIASAKGARWWITEISRRNPFLARKKFDSVIPAGGVAEFLEAKIPLTDEQHAIPLSGDEEREVLAWNPMLVSLGWDQNFWIAEVAPNDELPNPVRYCIVGLGREACLPETQGPDGGSGDQLPVDVGGTNTPLPLTHGENPDNRFSLQPNGSLTIVGNHSTGLTFEATAVFESGDPGNNWGTNPRLAWLYTGSQNNWSIPGATAYQSSRGGSVDLTLSARLVVDSPRNGDNFQLVALEPFQEASLGTDVTGLLWAAERSVLEQP